MLPLFFILAIALPFFALMIAWTAVTAFRLMRPEEPLSLDEEPSVRRELARRRGRSMPVGALEIREDQRRRVRTHRVDYEYEGPASARFPVDWMQDVQQRCN